MRLALGFCGQFAKTTLSSISIKTLEVGQHIEVRSTVFCTGWCSGADALLSLYPAALIVS